ncbi:MAG: nuclear transport factor 2 family protein [Clostridiales bacterium]|nr:nuclear transport factor 2 family protein [Clostridiales bacterium]
MDIYAFWDAVIRQDAQAIRPFFAKDAVICWHCSNERFTVDEFIRANCEYPGHWAAEMERLTETPGGLVTAMRVWPEDGEGSFHVASFFGLQDGLIRSLDEYWGDDGPAPDWRRQMHIGSSIRL